MAKSRPANSTSPRSKKQTAQPVSSFQTGILKTPPPAAAVPHEQPPVLRAIVLIIEELRARADRAANLTYAAGELVLAWGADLEPDRLHAVASTLECARDEALKTGEAAISLERLVESYSWGAELAA